MTEQRFFRATADVYAAFLHAVNTAWGLPSHGQTNAFAPVDEAPQAGGKLYLAVYAKDCHLEPVASALPPLIASGDVDEIDEATYWSASPPTPPMPE